MTKHDPFDTSQGDLVRDETVGASLKRAVKKAKPTSTDGSNFYSDHRAVDPQIGTRPADPSPAHHKRAAKGTEDEFGAAQPPANKPSLFDRLRDAKTSFSQAWSQALSQAESKQRQKREKKGK
jgi:hypothetical protein